MHAVMSRLILVSNRLPVVTTLEDNKPELVPAAGGLANGLRGVHEQSGGLWIGCPGEVSAFNDRQRHWLGTMFAERNLVPVWLEAEEVVAFYDDVANGMLWPLCHSFLDRLQLCPQSWARYCAVNKRFADVVAETARPGDTIWVNDYHLALVPALLRERLPDARIAFFLHVPFPPADIFAVLPWREEVLKGLLGANVVGFHTAQYSTHFRTSLARFLGVVSPSGRATWRGREVRIGSFPMGVDASAWGTRGQNAHEQADDIRAGAEGVRLLVSIDRLDYTKGIINRLKAFERLLESNPGLRGGVRLIQATVPSRQQLDAYAEHQSRVQELVGQINGAFATADWVPIVNFHRALAETEVAALYRAADVMLVTPLRDGMNLVAKEFVATRTDEDGVLVLSEFAGAARELEEALIVNPYDLDGVVDCIVRALEMSPSERRARMSALRQCVGRHDAGQWAMGFLGAMEEQKVAGGRPPRRSLRHEPTHRRTGGVRPRTASPSGG